MDYLSLVHLVTDETLVPGKSEWKLSCIHDLRDVDPDEQKGWEPLSSEVKDVLVDVVIEVITGDDSIHEESWV